LLRDPVLCSGGLCGSGPVCGSGPGAMRSGRLRSGLFLRVLCSGELPSAAPPLPPSLLLR